MIKKLKEKSVLILGFGKEGRDTLRFLQKKFPQKKIGIADRNVKKVKDKNVATYFGPDYLKAVNNYQLIIKSPGVPMSLLNPFKNKIITSQSDIFLNLNKGKVIGVTGTKGKSTTCLSIYTILKKKGFDVYLLGNIGEPVLSYLDKRGIFVYELSSFQLQTATKSPEIAVVLNIFKDHLDQHENFNEYLEAKKNILNFQKNSDKLIYNKEDSNVLKMVKKARAEKIPFNPKERISNSATYLDPILKVVELFDISREEAIKLINRTKKLSHRLEYIGKHKSIKFYNDSASTIPEAAIEAIKKINNLDTIIVGGVDKGGDYKPLAEEIANSQINNVIVFPKTGDLLKNLLKNFDLNIKRAENMDRAVKLAYRFTEKGKACLLSPASSSFNMFSNYKDRGNQFKKNVEKYGQKK